MITGPLGLRFGERLMPRLETGEIAGYDLPTPSRVRQWFDLAPTIGDDLFLKLYTHGAPGKKSRTAARTAVSATCSAGLRKKRIEEASRFTGPRPGKCTRLPKRLIHGRKRRFKPQRICAAEGSR